MQARNFRHGHRSISHTSGAYKSWLNMKQRCLNPNATAYSYYGGRGINICESWLTFENFYSDMGERPKDKTLDRIDPNGSYCKKNCKWSSHLEQRLNQRLNCRNISGHSNITWDKANKKWLVSIKNKNLGRYTVLEDAIVVKELYLKDKN